MEIFFQRTVNDTGLVTLESLEQFRSHEDYSILSEIPELFENLYRNKKCAVIYFNSPADFTMYLKRARQLSKQGQAAANFSGMAQRYVKEAMRVCALLGIMCRV